MLKSNHFPSCPLTRHVPQRTNNGNHCYPERDGRHQVTKIYYIAASGLDLMAATEGTANLLLLPIYTSKVKFKTPFGLMAFQSNYITQSSNHISITTPTLSSTTGNGDVCYSCSPNPSAQPLMPIPRHLSITLGRLLLRSYFYSLVKLFLPLDDLPPTRS